MTTKKTAKKKTAKKTTKKKVARKVPTRKKAVSKKAQARKRADKQFHDDVIARPDDWPWPLRPYQVEANNKFNEGIKRMGLFWHRRAGKDVFCLSLARNQSRRRIGGYVHFFPKHIQAKRAIWQGVDPRKGQKFIDIAFGDMVHQRNNQEMFLEFDNGSTWQMLGSDNYDRVVGSNIVCAFFSEWALCDPRAYDYIKPILVENNGVCIFITTFRGRNHAWQMMQNLKDNPDWYIDVRTVEDTTDIQGNRIITDAMIERERDEGMSEALIQQEYYCNPEATADGAIYGGQADRLRKDSSRQFAIWDASKPVHCVWNLDLPIYASYLMIQPGPRPQVLETGLLDFTTMGEAIAKVNNRPWPIMTHLLPDTQRELVSAFDGMGIRPEIVQVPFELMVNTQTEAFIERMTIDIENAGDLLDALAGYVRREKFQAQTADLMFAPDPVMSWHWRLAYPLEIYSVWEQNTGNEWGPVPDYSTQDRIARVRLN